MKTSTIKSVLIAAALLLGTHIGAQAQASLCSAVVATGCVGACGSPTTSTFYPTQDAKFNLHATSSSLCQSNVALATVYVNGVSQGTISLSGGGNLTFKAPQGAQVDVYAYISPFTIGNVQCVWLGEVYYEVCQL